MPYRRRRLPFKACKRCKALVEHDVQRCPYCSSTLFSDDWEGMVVILDPSKSKSAEVLGIKNSGRYAIKVR